MSTKAALNSALLMEFRTPITKYQDFTASSRRWQSEVIASDFEGVPDAGKMLLVGGDAARLYGL